MALFKISVSIPLRIQVAGGLDKKDEIKRRVANALNIPTKYVKVR